MNSEFVPKVKSPREKILQKIEKLTRKDGLAMDRAADEYIEDRDNFERFINQFEDWYNRNGKTYMRLLANYERDFISATEFKLIFRDMNAPFSDLQVHILYRWLDPKRKGVVDYAALYEAVFTSLLKRYTKEGENDVLDLEYQNKWIMMTFKCPSLEVLHSRFTFEALIHLGYTGAMLRILIEKRLPNLPTRKMILFTDISRHIETLIHCNQKLYRTSYQGGPKDAPTEGILFYEFSLGYIDCPLLLQTRATELNWKPEANRHGSLRGSEKLSDLKLPRLESDDLRKKTFSSVVTKPL